MIGYTVELIGSKTLSPWLVTFYFDGPMQDKRVELFTFRAQSESIANWLASAAYTEIKKGL